LYFFSSFPSLLSLSPYFSSTFHLHIPLSPFSFPHVTDDSTVEMFSSSIRFDSQFSNKYACAFELRKISPLNFPLSCSRYWFISI
jgi:hypothetical protein